MQTLHKTNMPVLLIVGPKCTLAASHAAPWWVTGCWRDRQTTDGQTPDHYIMFYAKCDQCNKNMYSLTYNMWI